MSLLAVSLQEAKRLLQLHDRLGEVDDVAAAAFAVDVLSHLRVPAAGLVAQNAPPLLIVV